MNRSILYCLCLLSFLFVGCEKEPSNGPSSSVQGGFQPLIPCTPDVEVTADTLDSWNNFYSVTFYVLIKVNEGYKIVGSGATTYTKDSNNEIEQRPFTAEVVDDNINTCHGVPLKLGVEYYIVCDSHLRGVYPEVMYPIGLGIWGYYTQHVKVKFTNAVHGRLRINLDSYYAQKFSLVEVGDGIEASLGGQIGSIIQ